MSPLPSRAHLPVWWYVVTFAPLLSSADTVRVNGTPGETVRGKLTARWSAGASTLNVRLVALNSPVLTVSASPRTGSPAVTTVELTPATKSRGASGLSEAPGAAWLQRAGPA